MLVKIFRWLRGFVKFKYENGFIDQFLNGCFVSGINLHNITSEKEGLTAIVSFDEYKQLHKIAFKSGGKVEIVKKRGIKLFFYPIRNRMGLFVGAIVFVLLLSYLSGFVWDVTIKGNKNVKDESIYTFIESNNLKSGVRWGNVDTHEIACDLMLKYPEISWIHINKDGCLAQIEINEAVPEPTLDNSKNVVNVRAKKDGVIFKTVVKRGWQVKKAGEAVTKGDLLISGVYESETDKKNYLVHASGKCVAEVEDELKVNVSREQSYKTYVSYDTAKYISFFGLTIPIKLCSTNDPNTDVLEEKSFVKLNKKQLPIGVITKTVRKYEAKTAMLSDKDLEALAKKAMAKKINEELKNAEIVSREYKIKSDADSCVLTAKIKSFQDIGEEIKVPVEKISK